MIIDRIFTPGLAQVAYLVADETAGEVAVIDPRRDVDEYISWANERGFRITAILETHVHADFVSGSLELAARTGAPIYVSWMSGQTFVHNPLCDGQDVAFGSLLLRAFWTPGHTPEISATCRSIPRRAPVQSRSSRGTRCLWAMSADRICWALSRRRNSQPASITP